MKGSRSDVLEFLAEEHGYTAEEAEAVLQKHAELYQKLNETQAFDFFIAERIAAAEKLRVKQECSE